MTPTEHAQLIGIRYGMRKTERQTKLRHDLRGTRQATSPNVYSRRGTESLSRTRKETPNS